MYTYPLSVLCLFDSKGQASIQYVSSVLQVRRFFVIAKDSSLIADSQVFHLISFPHFFF